MRWRDPELNAIARTNRFLFVRSDWNCNRLSTGIESAADDKFRTEEVDPFDDGTHSVDILET